MTPASTLVDDARRRARRARRPSRSRRGRSGSAGTPRLARELRVRREHPELAVHGHHRPRAQQREHRAQLLGVPVARDVHRRDLLVQHLRARTCASRLIVSWTRSSFPGTGFAEMITVSPRSTVIGRVVVVRDPRQRRQRLALAAGAEDRAPRSGRYSSSSAGRISVALGHVDVAEVARDVEVLAHRAADDADLAADLDGDVDRLLHPVDVRGERGDEDAARCAAG